VVANIVENGGTMKILVVTRDAPMLGSGGGRGARNTHLLRALSEAHRVTLLIVTDDPAVATRDGAGLGAGLEALRVVGAPLSRYKRAWQVASAALRQPCQTLRFSPPGAGRAIRALLAAERFDAVVYQSVEVADHRLPLGPRVVIDEHNLEYELMERSAAQARSMSRRLHYALEAAALKRVELGLLARADLVSVTSERERERLGALLPDASVVVTPNGVDTEAFAPDPERAETPERVIFTGTMDYHPNEQAVHYFADTIWPRVRAEVPGATWYLVGARPPASFQRLAALPGVTVTGTVAETQPYLAAAAVAIAPLLVGGGTRLKIVEALAMGKAVVTTALGCEGLNVMSGEHLLVADDPGEFADAVIGLLRDDARRARLGAAGRALVEREYSWTRSGRVLVQAVEWCVADWGGERDVAVAGD
jgi:sugar transferase (PEP-CTERM/EpsH1 system associated)